MQRMLDEETKRLNIILEEGIEKELKKQKPSSTGVNLFSKKKKKKKGKGSKKSSTSSSSTSPSN